MCNSLPSSPTFSEVGAARWALKGPLQPEIVSLIGYSQANTLTAYSISDSPLMTIFSYKRFIVPSYRTHLFNRGLIALTLAASVLSRPDAKAQQGTSPQIIVTGQTV